LPPERLDLFLVAVNEIMANAVRHGGGHGRVRLWHGGDLVCRVDDQGPGFLASSYLNQITTPASSHAGGRGLWLARHTCDSLAVDSGPSGTTVYISARLPARPEE
jgi:anti-sigma regulatory factor (Ser/Thr protein kinase)